MFFSFNSFHVSLYVFGKKAHQSDLSLPEGKNRFVSFFSFVEYLSDLNSYLSALSSSIFNFFRYRKARNLQSLSNQPISQVHISVFF